MNKKQLNLINKLKIILDDPDVKKIEDLTNMLTTYKIQLENGAEYSLLCTKLSSSISTYLLTHQFKAPTSILNIYNELERTASKYKGLSAINIWLS